MYKLNQNLKATIATKFSQTDVINIKYSIKQGKPLSTPAFAFFDRTAKCGYQQKDMGSCIVT